MKRLNDDSLNVNDLETERTPGGVAVSQATEWGRRDGALPSLPATLPPGDIPEPGRQTHTENNREDRDAFIVGWQALRTLLQPAHVWFRDKRAHIVTWALYRHQDTVDGKVFAFAKVKAESRNNPYRRYQLSRSHSGRTIGQLAGVIVNNNLKDMRLASLVFTFPREVSEQLADRGDKGRALAWNCFRKVWAEIPALAGATGELAAMTNLHLWKTERPIDPHFHFHVLIPNWSRDTEGSWTKWFGTGAGKQYVDSNGAARVGGVPLSDEELQAVKDAWTRIVRASCRRNGVKCGYWESGRTLNVYCDYARWENGEGKAKFIHKVNYQRRHWTEDYAIYSEKHPDCADPPAWLVKYNNGSRIFGWWRSLKSLAEGAELAEDGKIDILTGEPLVRSAGGPVELDACRLWSYDSLKGKACIGRLTAEDIAWLDLAWPRFYEGTDTGQPVT